MCELMSFHNFNVMILNLKFIYDYENDLDEIALNRISYIKL